MQGLRSFFNDFTSKIEPKKRFECIKRCLLNVLSAKSQNDELPAYFFCLDTITSILIFEKTRLLDTIFFKK